MKLKINYKTTASIMVSAILAVIVWIGIAQSMAMVANSSFKSIKSGRTALQAQQYADISIDRLKNINYDELDINGAHSRKKIEGISSNDWQDEVTIGAESTIGGSDDAKQRIATVNVYKVGDTMPRYTVEVPLSSQGKSNNYIGMSNYIAPSDGYLWWSFNTNTGYGCFYVYINDQIIPKASSTSFLDGDVHHCDFFPLSKGDKVKIINSLCVEFTFYPCKF